MIEAQTQFIEEATKIAGEIPQFTEGYRVLFLIQRTSDGGDTNNSKLRSYVSRNHDEWVQFLAKLLEERSFYPHLSLRIYQSLNDRNIEKAIRYFKGHMLNADFYAEPDRLSFYTQIQRRWLSSLMIPASRNSSWFLFDIDIKDKNVGYDVIAQLPIDVAEKAILRETKNGYHLFTPPFNHTTLQYLVDFPEKVSLKKDALMLLKY